MTQAIFTTPTQAILPITVFYDHSCSLCRSEVENLSSRDNDANMRLVDCSAPHFDTTQLPFDQSTLMNCIHAVDATGKWLKGTDVFVVCYRVANMQTLARIFAFARPVAERIYPWIVRHRYVLSGLGVHRLFNALTHRHIQRQASQAWASSQACKDGLCEINPHANASNDKVTKEAGK